MYITHANLLRMATPAKINIARITIAPIIPQKRIRCWNLDSILKKPKIMPMTNELKRLIAQGASLDDLKREAYREGVLPLRIEGAKRISQGITTLEEVLRVVPLH